MENDVEAALRKISEDTYALGELRSCVRRLEAEVSELMKWRLQVTAHLSALSALPEGIAKLTEGVKELRKQLSDVSIQLHENAAERRERDRVGVWVRWLVPSGWITALLAAIMLWMERRR